MMHTEIYLARCRILVVNERLARLAECSLDVLMQLYEQDWVYKDFL